MSVTSISGARRRPSCPSNSRARRRTLPCRAAKTPSCGCSIAATSVGSGLSYRRSTSTPVGSLPHGMVGPGERQCRVVLRGGGTGVSRLSRREGCGWAYHPFATMARLRELQFAHRRRQPSLRRGLRRRYRPRSAEREGLVGLKPACRWRRDRWDPLAEPIVANGCLYIADEARRVSSSAWLATEWFLGENRPQCVLPSATVAYSTVANCISTLGKSWIGGDRHPESSCPKTYTSKT
jgi:hypothetical protein